MVLKLNKSKKGQIIFIGIMTAIMVFILLVQFITPLKYFVTSARTDIGCATMSNLTTGTQAACIVVDWYLPYFLCAGIAVSIGFITQRRYVQIQQ